MKTDLEKVLKEYIIKTVMTAFLMLSFCLFKPNMFNKVYASTITVKKGDKEEATKVHKVIYKAKAVNLKVLGKAKAASAKVKKIKNAIKKVNNYGVVFDAKKKKTIGGYTYYKVKKEYASRYREAVLTLKAMRKDYIERNEEEFSDMISFAQDDNIYIGYEYRLTKSDSGATNEPGINDGYTSVSYTLIRRTDGDEEIIAEIFYYPELGYYDFGDYFGYAAKMINGDYLDCLKDIEAYKVENIEGDTVAHYHFDQNFFDKLNKEIDAHTKKQEAEKKRIIENHENLTEEAVKYLPSGGDYKTRYKRFLKIRDTKFCELSTAMQVVCISDCFWCDYNDEERNAFIHYKYSKSGSSGATLYHWPNKPNKYYIVDYTYEGNSPFAMFKKAKKGKVSTILKKFRKGKFYGVCHDYATVERYIYTSMGLSSYYCYSKYANHAISAVKVKNSKGKSFWAYQNYDELLDANDIVGISGISIAAKNYDPLNANKGTANKIKKSKFKASDFN